MRNPLFALPALVIGLVAAPSLAVLPPDATEHFYLTGDFHSHEVAKNVDGINIGMYVDIVNTSESP